MADYKIVRHCYLCKKRFAIAKGAFEKFCSECKTKVNEDAED